MKPAHLVTLVALALPSAALAPKTGRFFLDEGRASAVFPDGAPIRISMTQESIPGVGPAGGPLPRMLPSESWMDRGSGQTYSVIVLRSHDVAYPVSQTCSPPRTRDMGERTMTSTCRMVSQAGSPVAEHRIAWSDGALTVMRTFERGDRRYLVSFMRLSDKLRSRSAAMMKGPPAEPADGEAFLDSFRLDPTPTH